LSLKEIGYVEAARASGGGGLMLKSGVDNISISPWLAVFPGLAIMFAVMAFNMVGDGLRDALDPKLQG
jgi:ABC-type dipeptide/oligopeptide/nickel transport system permease subunit